jgi:hypothetical protein
MLTIFRLYRCGDIIRVIILSEIFMAFLNYNKDEKLEFNYKRANADKPIYNIKHTKPTNRAVYKTINDK